jgi:asparagine synthase (glutamine-hydrolysing)
MCGICGKVNFRTPPGKEKLEKINQKLTHRGPDFGCVMEIDSIATFGHRRLSIIDLSALAHQPMQDLSKVYTITYNGETYNFQEIKKELIQYGYHFKSNSDTEVVLYAYIHWGVKCFEKFNGMFALAIWNSKEKELILAKDRFGKKPLYYTLLNDEITFASELTALMEDKEIKNKVTLSISAINHYLALGYILSPLTIYREIYKLEPATYIKFKDGKTTEKTRYWEYKDYFLRLTKEKEKEIRENLDHLFDKSIRYRLISDVPVGAFLSGGLDSSGVVAFTKKYNKDSLHTFSIGFSYESYNEAPDAKLVSDYLKTIHHEKIFDKDLDKDIINKCISKYDEPFSDTSLIPMVEVSKLASTYLKVVLSGDGADEIFAGYETYKADKIKKSFDILPGQIRNGLASLLNKLTGETNKKVSFGFKLKQFSKGLPKDYHYAHYAWRELHSESERISIIGAEYKDEIISSDPYLVFKKYYDEVPELDYISQHLYVDVKTWLSDDILVKIDRATMAYSLESRSPFLDKDLIEYAATIPSQYKIKNNGKYILKKMLEKYLPKETIYKKKSGFNAPVNNWLGNNKENEFKFFNKYVLKEKGVNYSISVIK